MPEQNKYQHFSDSDFITDEYFQSWIFRADEVVNLFWKKFISDNPEKADAISQAKLFLESIEFKEDYPSEERVREYLNSTLTIIDSPQIEKPVASLRSPNLKWWAAAASIVLLFLLGYFFFINQNTPQIANASESDELIKDIAPGGNKAILTLGNGQAIVLDSAGNGMVSTQGNAVIIKLADGQIAYEGDVNSTSNETVYNTISTPRGGQYNLTLSDGSKVWLNAESSLRFPASFSSKNRTVELTGEGYFEVAQKEKNGVKQSFIVLTKNQEIEVLGTTFNVLAYNDVQEIKTTLLEGSVKVATEGSELILKPGEQSTSSGTSIKKKYVDIEPVIAWKNNEFVFNEMELREVMEMLSRWYDVEISYDKDLPPTYLYGSISRNKGLAEVLKIMDMSGLKFRIEKNKSENRLIIFK